MPTPLTLASWNVNSLKVRLPQVLDWLAETRTDAVVLQETKLVDEAFPVEALAEAGYEAIFTGQKTYNGVALLYRRETLRVANPERTTLNLPGLPDEQKRFVATELAPAAGGEAFVFCGGYIPNGMETGSWKFLYKLDWLAALERVTGEFLRTNPRLVLGGDFNIAPEDRDCWNPAEREGQILVSKPERAALARLMRTCGLSDAFRLFPQSPETYSWWDYRQAGFEKNRGLRIDLLLVSEALRARVKASTVDARPRANAQPSDHAPVTLALELD